MPATLPELDLIEPSAPPKRTGFLRRILSMRFLVVSIAVHLLLGLLAAVWVVQSYSTNRKLTFKGGPPSPNPSSRAIEHKVQMAKKQSTASAPASKRIVSTGLSKVTLPEMPAMPKTAAAPSKMAGAGGANIAPAAGPMGAAASSAGGGLVSMFGLRETKGSQLTGTFYDLKQDKNGTPNKMAIAGEMFSKKEEPMFQSFSSELSRFVKAGMTAGSLSEFFQGPTPLYTTQIFIPKIEAEDGPKAFNLLGRVKPRRWAVVYRGKVIAPEDGRYRFVGVGDDYLVVRFNGQIVLDASPMNPSGRKMNKTYNAEGFPAGSDGLAQLYEGDAIEAKAGTPYPMEILIAESPGGSFKAFLMISKEGVELPKDDRKNPKFPVFKLAPSQIPKPRTEAPVFSPDTSWSIWKGG